MSHPSEDDLLRYSDGELSGAASGRIESHLKACWQCRAALEEVEATVGACVRYRTNVLQRHLPAPPEPWTDIYRSLAEIDASLDHPAFTQRLARFFAWPLHHARQWTPVAIALFLAIGLFYRYRLTPSVQAAELLHKAIAAADTHPLKTHRLHVRTSTHSFTRAIGSTAALALNSSDQAELDSLQTLFHKANYNWDDPLSPKSFAAWRDQLPSEHDQVTETSSVYRVQTTADSGDLLQASLEFRPQDLEPILGRFEFRNQEWVEITAAPDPEPSGANLPNFTAPAPERSLAPRPAASSERAAAPSPGATISDELRVLTALHQINADLGDPLQISRTGGVVLVAGSGIAPDRREQIQQALAQIPRVSVQFSDIAPSSAPPEQPALANPQTGDNRRLQSRIAEQLGGRTNFEQLAAQVLDMTEPLMARVYALRRLEDRFPIDVEAQLSAQDLDALRHLQREHLAALSQQTAALDQALKPVLSSKLRRTPAPASSSTAWQPATEELFQSARHVEKLLAVMFGASASDSIDPQQLPSDLALGVAQLRAKVEGYSHLLANTEK